MEERITTVRLDQDFDVQDPSETLASDPDYISWANHMDTETIAALDGEIDYENGIGLWDGCDRYPRGSVERDIYSKAWVTAQSRAYDEKYPEGWKNFLRALDLPTDRISLEKFEQEGEE